MCHGREACFQGFLTMASRLPLHSAQKRGSEMQFAAGGFFERSASLVTYCSVNPAAIWPGGKRVPWPRIGLLDGSAPPGLSSLLDWASLTSSGDCCRPQFEIP